MLFLGKHWTNPTAETVGPKRFPATRVRPGGCERSRPAAWLPSNAARPGTPWAAAARPSPWGTRPRGFILPLFSSVLPRAGCRGAAGAGVRESSRWAGTSVAAHLVSGVKERPWHPSPQGSVSSTLGNRARPAPTGALHLPDLPPGAPCRALVGACGFAKPVRQPRTQRRKLTEHPVHRERGPGKARDGAGSGRGDGAPSAHAALAAEFSLRPALRRGTFPSLAAPNQRLSSY